MEPGATLDRAFRTGDGRLRLGWRLALYLGVVVAVAGAVGAMLPGGLVTGQAAFLTGGLVAGVLLLALDGRPAGALGFYLAPAAVRETTLGLALGGLVALAVVAILAAVGGLRWTPQDGSAASWLAGGGAALLLLAVPAAAEEALLRGYPLQALAESWGPAAALAVTAGVFGALHLFNPNPTALGTLNVAIAGVFLGVVYLRTGSLWWATGAHLGWNWAHGYVADVPVSGLELLDAPLYEGLALGPEWLGGGSFGPEGSLVATVVIAAASLACWRGRWLRPSAAALAARPLVIVEARPA